MTAETFADARAMAAALTPSFPVYCLRPEVFTQAAERFLELFPGRVLYAMKCNPHPRVLRALYDAGVRHFDTASLPEIAAVNELFPDALAYFMHPVKARAVIKIAYEVYGVRHYVIDHAGELAKVLDETGGEGITIIVRLATPHAGAVFDLSTKFGARPALAAELLREVDRKGCKAGMSFHVGSQCLVPHAYRSALDLVGEVVEAANTGLAVLDVGGGFPGDYLGVEVPPLDAYIDEINAGLGALDLKSDCQLMCEPGRTLVAAGCSLVVQVQLRKEDQIYINDGVYGSLSEMATARFRMPAHLIRLDGEPSATHQEFTVAGPTCDSLDVLPVPFRLPEDVREGDWIEIEQMGAYASALRTRFNGFYPDTFVELTGASEPGRLAAPRKAAGLG